MLKNLIVIAFLSMSVIFASCDGEKGDVGPAGPAGPAGAQGPKGDSGVAGQNGIGARVLSAGAVKSTSGGYVLGASNISAEDSVFITNSVIQVFVKSQNRWWGMPGNAYWNDSTYTNFAYYSRLLNARLYVTLRAIAWSEDQPTAPERQFQDIRAVMIPATEFRMNAEVDYTNYEETMKSLGLTEEDVVKVN